jgi:GNAT superfamily N-acetyltransferase
MKKLKMEVYMKSRAIEYLNKDTLLYMGMIEPINRNTAKVLYASTDGVLLKEQDSGAYMLAVENYEKGVQLIDSLTECKLLVLHQKYMVDYAKNKFDLNRTQYCFQAVYTSKDSIEIEQNLHIKKLEVNQLEVISEHYKMLAKNDVEKLLKEGKLYGGYKAGNLVGFVGNHFEGSIGLLEVFPKYRKLGYGSALESFMINNNLKEGFTPFVQILEDNIKSIALQKKLGLQVSRDTLIWVY